MRRAVGTGLWAAALASGLTACPGGKCKTDAQCGSGEICAELVERDRPRARRCLATCASDADCLLTGKECLPVLDTASGPAS